MCQILSQLGSMTEVKISHEGCGADSRGSSKEVSLWFRGTAEGQLYAALVASLVMAMQGHSTTLCSS